MSNADEPSSSSAQPSELRAAWKLLRPLAQGNIAPYVMLGCALGVSRRGHFDPGRMAAALSLGLLVHAVVILLNEHGDWEGDRRHARPTLVSGGSGAAAAGVLSREQVGRAAAAAMLAFLLALCIALVWTDTGLILIGSATVFLAWSYAHPPLRLAYRGWGPILQLLGLGLTLPALGYVLQTGRSHDLPWLAFTPAMALGLAGNISTSLPDFEADSANQKRTIPVLLGPGLARLLCAAITAAAALAIEPTSLRLHPARLDWVRLVAGPLVTACLLTAPLPRILSLAWTYLQSATATVLLLGWIWSLAY